MQSKTANGLKKFRLNRHKAKRLQKSQKRKREHQERLASQGAFDRNDRRMGLTSWHQQNITLSHVILPNISQQDAPSKVKKPKKKKQEVSLAKEKETVPNENKKDKKLEKVEALESKNKKAKAKKNDPIDLGIKVPASASGNKKMNSAEAVEERIPAHQNCAESVSLPPSSANDSNHTKLCNGHGGGTTMPLAIDIDCQAAAGMESPLTKCSVDSGVGADSTTNGVSACACGDASMVADPSSCQSFSPPLESAEQADKNGEMEKKTKANVNGVADTGKLEQQRVYEFVDQVTERLKIQTLVANNEIAPMLLQSIKVEPLNLERIKLAERKRVKKPRQYKLLDSDIQYCRYMEEKYGRDFEAMSQDPRNIFGDSARSLERKVRIYKDFLRQCSEI